MGITFEEGFSPSDEGELFSVHTKNEPFANFLNDVGFATILTQSIIGALSLDGDKLRTTAFRAKDLPALLTTPEALASGITIGLPIVATIGAFNFLYGRYRAMPQAARLEVQRRVVEVRHNPLTIFRRTNRSTSSS